MFNNLKIGSKMLLLCGVILSLLLATLVWGTLGLSKTVENGSQVAGGNKLRSDLLQLEIKHDAWNNKVRDFLTQPEVTELNVKVDHQSCALGKWYYGAERNKAETLLPAISADMAAVEEPHRLMHQSARKIKEVYQAADQELPRLLDGLEQELVAWISSIQNALLAKHNQILAEKDHTRTKLGQFLHSDQAKQATATSTDFAKYLTGLQDPQRRLHTAAQRMDQALKNGKREEAFSVYDNDVLPTMAQVRFSLRMMKKAAEKALEGQQQAQQIYEAETWPNLVKLKQHLSAMIEISNANIMSDSEMISVAENTRNGIITLGGFALLVGVIIATLITRSMTIPMTKAVTMIEELEKGHLNSRLNMQRKDEIGRMASSMDRFSDSLQNEVVDSLQKLANGDLSFAITPRDADDLLRASLEKVCTDLNQLVGQIQTSSDQIASGSVQVSDSAQSLSQGATESAASLEEISSSMNVISSQIHQSADHADEANRLAGSARSSADTGSSRMAEMIGAMAEINEAGQNISKIIKVIDEIAFQTNLLALNAAVEAARAGQHGKGFAVVAEEVRNLAARSAKAARETAELIEGSVEKATNGTQIAERTAESLDEIVSSIGKVTNLIAEMASASKEQSNGVSQINVGLQQIDQVIQQSTAGAEESAATSEELSSQAAELKNMLGRFVLKETSRGTENFVRPAPQLLPDTPNDSRSWGQTAPSPAGNEFVIHWSDNFNTGVAMMDKQHQQLVKLINQLFRCMKEGGDLMVLGSVVDELVQYTITHFRAEEELMKRYNFPDLEAHKAIHEQFIAQVGEYAEKLKSGARLAPADIYKFLKDWLVSHIEEQDRDGYGHFINS